MTAKLIRCLVLKMVEIEPVPSKSMAKEGPKRGRIRATHYNGINFWVISAMCDGKKHSRPPGRQREGNSAQKRGKSHQGNSRSDRASSWYHLGIPQPSPKSHIKVFYFILPAVNSLLSTSLSGGWWVDSLQNGSDQRTPSSLGWYTFASKPFLHPRRWEEKPRSLKISEIQNTAKKKPLENSVTSVCFHWPISL